MTSISIRYLGRGITSVVIPLLLTCSLHAQLVSFVARRDFPSANSVASVTVADLNSDGNPDLVVVNPGSGVSVMLGDGNGRFTAPMSFPAGASPNFVAAADINGDNKPDLVVTNQFSSTISILFGKGDGTFSSPASVSVDFNPVAIAIADFNGDGKVDLAVACSGFSSTGTVSVLLGNGDGTFKPRQSFFVGSNPSFVAAGDLNGDGRPDLAVANFGSNNVSILLGRGDGTFLAATNIGTGSGPRWLAITDFDGNHSLDLAVANSNSDEISILLGRGDGTFQSPLNIAVAASPVSVASADFNGDNIPDLVLAHAGGFNNAGSVSVLIGNGDGSFQAPTNYAVSGIANAVTIADFNRDGFSDVVVSETINSSSSTGSISEFLGNGDGTFESAGTIAIAQPGSIAIADFDGDGRLDVAATSANSNSVSVFLGNGDGTFQPAKSSSSGINASLLVVGDFNNDGIPDLAVANFASLAILLGNGDGTFQAPRMVNLNLNAVTLAVGDFDSDGRLDLAVAGGGFGGAFNGVVLLGNGDGSFQPAKGFSTGTSTISSLATADFNGDGRPDVVVANSFSDTVSVLLGNGDGTFSQPKDIPVGRNPVAVAVGDMNGDGFADIAVANSGANNISLLLGDGNGAFQAAFNFDVGTNPSALTFGDFNNDGKVDLAVANQGSNTISILLNSAGAALSSQDISPFAVVRTLPAANFGVGAGPAGLVAGDLNGDLLLDLLTVNHTSNTISVLINNTVAPPTP